MSISKSPQPIGEISSYADALLRDLDIKNNKKFIVVLFAD